MVGIKGQALNPGQSTYDVEYCDPSNPHSNLSARYILYTGSSKTQYVFPSDLEYYQVITAMTISEASQLFLGYPQESLPQILTSGTKIRYNKRENIPIINLPGSWGSISETPEYPISSLFENFNKQYIVILQRGVDPYSPKFVNKYGIGRLFGSSDPNAITITAETRLNIPIQKLPATNMSVQPFNGQSDIFYPSHFFKGGITTQNIPGEQWSAFTTFNVG